MDKIVTKLHFPQKSQFSPVLRERAIFYSSLQNIKSERGSKYSVKVPKIFPNIDTERADDIGV